MKKLISLLIFCFLVGFFFACENQFTDELNIRALDAKNRPLPNASISLYYQLSSSTGKGYTTTTPKLTDGDGTVYIKVQNLEKQSAYLDCNIKITAEYGGKSAERTVTANSHATLIDLNLDVYSLVVTVEDQYGNKLEGALVTVDMFEAYTNEIGWSLLRIGSGEKTLFVSYKGAEREEQLLVEDDTQFEVSFFVSDLILTVVDDNGIPLEAEANFNNEQYQTENGAITIPNVGTSEPEILVVYSGLEKYPEIDLSKEQEYLVVYDFTPPVVSSVKENHTETITKLLIVIQDPGLYPSGVAPSSFAVHYDTGEGWKEAKVYSKGGNLYIAEIEHVPLNSVVFFEIYIEDNEGNSASVPGQYSIFEVPDNGDNGNGNGTNGGDGGFDIFGICINAVGLIVLLAILYFLYKKFLKKEE